MKELQSYSKLLSIVLLATFATYLVILREVTSVNNFKKACSDINGKEFSIETINTLKGSCSNKCNESGCSGTKVCSNHDLEDFKEFINTCGRFIVSDHTYGVPGREDLWTSEFKQFHECFVEFNRYRSNWVGHQGMFWVANYKIKYRPRLLECRIEQIYPAIKAVPIETN